MVLLRDFRDRNLTKHMTGGQGVESSPPNADVFFTEIFPNPSGLRSRGIFYGIDADSNLDEPG
jgi:hypothetical protein